MGLKYGGECVICHCTSELSWGQNNCCSSQCALKYWEQEGRSLRSLVRDEKRCWLFMVLGFICLVLFLWLVTGCENEYSWKRVHNRSVADTMIHDSKMERVTSLTPAEAYLTGWRDCALELDRLLEANPE